MPLSGDGTNSDGDKYEWEITGFGQLEGRWTEGTPAESTVESHIADPDWGMLIHYESGDSEGWFFIHGGYDPDDLPDIIDMYMEQYG